MGTGVGAGVGDGVGSTVSNTTTAEPIARNEKSATAAKRAMAKTMRRK